MDITACILSIIIFDFNMENLYVFEILINNKSFGCGGYLVGCKYIATPTDNINAPIKNTINPRNNPSTLYPGIKKNQTSTKNPITKEVIRQENLGIFFLLIIASTTKVNIPKIILDMKMGI